MASQPTNGTGTPILEKPKGRSAGEKRYRIELGCGSAAKEALDRWRLFVDTCDCSGPVELLHKALDSLLVQSRCAHGDHEGPHPISQYKPLTMDVGSQYRLLDTIATPTCLTRPLLPKPPSPADTKAPSEKPILHPANGRQQGVRKRQRRRKKPIGVGTISENTKRILLEHIPERGSEGKCVPNCEAEPDRVPSTTHSQVPPSTTSHLLLPASSSASSSSSSLSFSSTVPLNTPNPAHSQAANFEPATAVKLDNFPAALTLQPGLVALPTPIFTRFHPELESKSMPNLIPVTWSSTSEVRGSSTDAVATTAVTPPSSSMGEGECVSELRRETSLSEEGGDQLEEAKEMSQEEEESGTNVTAVLPRRRGRIPGKNRRTRPVIPRKKKTKGLGGSISEATRRILLEHTSSDRASDTNKLSETTRRVLIEHTSGDKASRSSDMATEAVMRGARTIVITPSESGRSLESTSGHQSVMFPGTISESTKRILLEYYS